MTKQGGRHMNVNASNKTGLLDDSQAYGRISRVLHWLGGLLTLTLFGLGFSAWLLGEGTGHHRAAAWHMALGGLLALPLLLRVGWRVAILVGRRGPRPLAPSGWARYAERAVHLGLLAMLTALVVSGPLIRWLGEHTVEVFGWFEIPSPIGVDKHLRDYAWAVHHRGWQVLAVLIVVHAVAALHHGRDAWVRMRWFARRSTD